MKSFFKILLASCLGTFIALLGLFFVMLFVIKGLIGGRNVSDISDHTVLKLEVTPDISDIASAGPVFTMDGFDLSTGKNLRHLILAIDKAAADDDVDGLVLELGLFSPSLATLEELREAINRFKDSGKFVYAYSDMMGQKSYYLATAADSIFMNPAAYFELKGFAAQIQFYKNTLEKLGVEVQTFPAGKYKSAVEPFSKTEISQANRVQLRSYLSSIYHHYLSTISGERVIDPDHLDSVIAAFSTRTPPAALANGLIDGIKYHDEFRDLLFRQTGEEEDDDWQIISLSKYAGQFEDEFSGSKADDDQIAIVYVQGEFQDGKGSGNKVGAETYVSIFRELRTNEDVKAVVLRISSPGGSSFASEKLWREIRLLKAEKPVVVSMGNLAASAAYHMASASDYIFAQPNTLTGSIGVFAMWPNFKELYNKHLGITVDTVLTHPYADFGNIYRPLTEKERHMIQAEVDKTYDDFLVAVAEGRHMDTAAVHKIAQGRIWTGMQAVENGLVDQLGNLQDALNYAANKAGIEEFNPVEYPQPKNKFERAMDMFGLNSQYPLPELLQKARPLLEPESWFLEHAYLQKRLPLEMDIE